MRGGKNLNIFHVWGLHDFRVASFQLAVSSLCSLVAFDVEIDVRLQRCPACRFESLQDPEKNQASKTHITPFHKNSLTCTSIAWSIGQIYSGPARAVSFRCCLQRKALHSFSTVNSTWTPKMACLIMPSEN